jgi:hypothetical protein
MVNQTLVAENALVLTTANILAGDVLNKVLADNEDIIKMALPEDGQSHASDVVSNMIAARLRSNLK